MVIVGEFLIFSESTHSVTRRALLAGALSCRSQMCLKTVSGQGFDDFFFKFPQYIVIVE